MSDIIAGRNGVMEALKSDHSINKIYMQKGNLDGSINAIYKLAKEMKLPIMTVDKSKLDEMYEGKHQGVIAEIAAYDYVEIEDILAKAKDKGEAPFVLILADLEDPHNLGAILRTADACGVHGVIIPKKNSVALNATVAKVSAGAILHVPVARVSNLNQTVIKLKDNGLWIYGADMGGNNMWKSKLTGPIGLVIGAEGSGIPRLLKENCDELVSIPMSGEIGSLNASVATGVLCYEISRQRIGN